MSGKKESGDASGKKIEGEKADGDASSGQDAASDGMETAAAEKNASAQDAAAGEAGPAASKKNAESVEELTDHLKRLAAEFDNYKKRVAKERLESEGRGAAKMIEKLLPFLDEFEIALAAAEKSQDEALKNGMKLMHGKFRGLLGKEGLCEMSPLGEKFDPYRHEAAMHEESDAEDGTIVRVIRKGYLLNGKILRHAMVGVSSGAKQREICRNDVHFPKENASDIAKGDAEVSSVSKNKNENGGTGTSEGAGMSNSGKGGKGAGEKNSGANSGSSAATEKGDCGCV